MSFPRYLEYKASGVEWLGEVPAHWDCAPLKTASTHNDDVLEESTEADAELAYVDISSVDANVGIISVEEIRFGQAPSRARRRVKDGDVIVSTVRTYLKAIARVRNPQPNLVVSTGFVVIRPTSRIAGEYLGFLVGARFFVDEVIARSTGVSYPAINASELVAIKVPVPPVAEQRIIAAFLDRETAKIDALVAEQRRLMELLKEKRQAVISHAVTKGLNPDAPMKDSGIDWVGDIPAHWDCPRNKVVFEEIDDRSTSDQGELMTVSHITGVTPRSEKDVNMFLAETLEGYKVCKRGDLVINTMWAWMGALGCSPCDGLVSPSYNVYRLRRTDALLSPYYDLLCRIPSHKVAMKANSTGVWESRLRLYPDSFLSMSLPLPPKEEQFAIAGFLEGEMARWNALIDEADSAVGLLKERRSALISAAVTGQIDVRGLASEAAA